MAKSKITICSSVKFYEFAASLSKEIDELGIETVLPPAAQNIKDGVDNNQETMIDYENDPNAHTVKGKLIRAHFEKIQSADATLIINNEKHGKKNYIGPNVLMEMAVSFYLNKPIYVLNDKPEDSPFIDEILGMKPSFLKGDINRLKEIL